MHDEGVEAVDHEDAGSALIEECRRRSPEVLEAPRVSGPDSVPEGGDPKEVSAIDHGRWTAGGNPEERGVRLREEANEGNRDLLHIEGEIALASLQRRFDDAPP
jgi:hypothetical protein